MRHLGPQEHPAFYASSRLTLNVTRAAMAAMGWCPSGRLFEATACGAAVLSDAFDEARRVNLAFQVRRREIGACRGEARIEVHQPYRSQSN